MQNIDPNPFEKIECQDQNGTPVTVGKHAIISESKSLVGDKVRTSSSRYTFLVNGHEVVQIDEQTFRVPQTDQILKIQA